MISKGFAGVVIRNLTLQANLETFPLCANYIAKYSPKLRDFKRKIRHFSYVITQNCMRPFETSVPCIKLVTELTYFLNFIRVITRIYGFRRTNRVSELDYVLTIKTRAFSPKLLLACTGCFSLTYNIWFKRNESHGF